MRIVYYLIIKPLSLLPFWVLYRISDLLYILIYYVLAYRKKVVWSNISSTLTHLNDKEKVNVMKGFYQHFCDFIVESVKLFSIDEATLRKRMKFNNLEVLEPYMQSEQSFLAVGYHYNNWEYFASASNSSFGEHQGYGIYTPIQNSFLAKKFLKSRTMGGLILLAKKETKAFFDDPKHPFVVIFLSDQSPSIGRKAFETTFLGRKTRVQFGLEKYAVEHNLPVVDFVIKKVKRGYYETTYRLLCDEPSKTKYGDITKMHCETLEKIILEDPTYWLWSHKRWKGMSE